MRNLAPTLASVLALAATPVGLGAAEGFQRQGQASAQFIYLQASAGDDSVAGLTDLTVTGERNGFRRRGYVEADRGCVEIRAVNMHAGMYFGGDTSRQTCRAGRRVPVDAWTRHTDVVLTAIVDGRPDCDSRIVTLTGRP